MNYLNRHIWRQSFFPLSSLPSLIHLAAVLSIDESSLHPGSTAVAGVSPVSTTKRSALSILVGCTCL